MNTSRYSNILVEVYLNDETTLMFADLDDQGDKFYGVELDTGSRCIIPLSSVKYIRMIDQK